MCVYSSIFFNNLQCACTDNEDPTREATIQHLANVTAAQIKLHHVDFVFAAAALI